MADFSSVSIEKRRAMIQKQSLPYEAKLVLAEQRIREFQQWADEHEKNTYVSVGGLDSITLLMFIRSLGFDIPAVSVSALEDVSIQRVHKQLGVERIKPYMKMSEVISEFGYPILSKEKASQIEALQNPTVRNQKMRHAAMTGEVSVAGMCVKFVRKRRLSKKWLKLFGGLENEKYETDYKIAPFKVSDKCCYYTKEKPTVVWAKEHNSVPYQGLMASEGGKRELALVNNGCNLFSERSTRSCPFAVFNRQDLLRLALDLNVPVPDIYGTIERKEDGTLYTTGAQRTGCMMCGFGIHVEKRPHRFDRLREKNPKVWNHVMYEEGWGEVLSYIGVGWKDLPEVKKEGLK